MNMISKYLLWKKIKRRRSPQSTKQLYFTQPKKEEISENPGAMVCRVCTSPADIPITEQLEGINVLSAINTVVNICISSADCYPKYVCKNCLDELKIALAFKKKCEHSDWKFRLSSSERAFAVDAPQGMVFHDFELILRQMRERRTYIQKQRSKVISHESEEFGRPVNMTKKNVKAEPKALKLYHKCKRCDLTFDTKGLLLNHRLEKNCASPPCPLCGKLVANLSRHKKIVHLRTEKHTCHVCGKVSFSSGGLRNHLLVHSNKFGYSCPLCPYKGKQRAYLTLHMRVHSEERPYLCSECPAKFVNPSNLRKHQLTHSSKKFECIKCKKQFRLEKTLKEHYDAAHLNMRYRCSVCGRSMWTRRKLLSHELRVHNREKHKLYEEVYKVVVNDENCIQGGNLRRGSKGSDLSTVVATGKHS